MKVLTEQERELYLQALAERKTEAKVRGQVDNASLYAGSPMYFYCNICGLETDVKPENYMTTPKRRCEECCGLVAAGFSPSLMKFPG